MEGYAGHGGPSGAGQRVSESLQTTSFSSKKCMDGWTLLLGTLARRCQAEKPFLNGRQILFDPWSKFKESGIEGSAQRGLVTCHGLAQYPDLFVGASMGPAGRGGRAVRTCL